MLNKEKMGFRFALGFILAVVSIGLYAQVANDPQVPISDVFNDIAELVKNFKGMKGIAAASSILMILVQILKTELFGGLMDKLSPIAKRITITILGQIAGIVMAISGGLGWLDAVVAGLLTSGGAVAIWEALKPIFKKKE